MQKEEAYCDSSVPPFVLPVPGQNPCFHTEFSSNAFRAITAFCFMFLAVVQASYGYKVISILYPTFYFDFNLLFLLFSSLFHEFSITISLYISEIYSWQKLANIRFFTY